MNSKFQLCVFLAVWTCWNIVHSGAKPDCDDGNEKILKHKSDTKSWFELEFEPDIGSGKKREDKIQKLVMGNDWEKFRKRNPDDYSDAPKAFRGADNSDQKIIVTGELEADGSQPEFSLMKVKLKMINAKEVEITGYDASGVEQFRESKVPKNTTQIFNQKNEYSKYKKVSFTGEAGNVITRLVINIQFEDATPNNKNSNLFIRGLLLKACVKN